MQRPRSVEEVSSLVRGAARVQVVAAGHSFHLPAGHVGDREPDLVLDLQPNMGRVLQVDPGAGRCVVEGGCTFATLVTALEARQMALENTASVLEISVAGAVLTGTHGSGQRHRVLADMVLAMELVTASGEVIELLEEDSRSNFMHLGLLGVVTKLTLRIVPFYEVAQRVYECLPFETLLGNLSRLAARCYSTSFWVDWGVSDEAKRTVMSRRRVSAEARAGCWSGRGTGCRPPPRKSLRFQPKARSPRRRRPLRWLRFLLRGGCSLVARSSSQAHGYVRSLSC